MATGSLDGLEILDLLLESGNRLVHQLLVAMVRTDPKPDQSLFGRSLASAVQLRRAKPPRRTRIPTLLSHNDGRRGSVDRDSSRERGAIIDAARRGDIDGGNCLVEIDRRRGCGGGVIRGCRLAIALAAPDIHPSRKSRTPPQVPFCYQTTSGAVIA